MKKKLLFIILLCLTITGNRVFAQEDMFKALFMYNFTKDIEWPADQREGNFKITVLGNSDIVEELEKIATKKKVGNQSIKVERVNDVTEISSAHIIYVTPAKSALLNEVISKIGDEPVLLVTDKEGLAGQGAGINYLKVNGKQKFEINPSNITHQGLKVNSFLLSLGIVID